MLGTLVIGGGQAGLAAGYFLGRTGQSFRILDVHARTGDNWRSRYDSLVLFTPAGCSSLPGLPFPGDPERYPTKDEVADYLEAYARTLHLPVEHGECVTRVQRLPGGFEVRTDRHLWRARQVIVATGPFQAPFVPAFATSLSREVFQVHSSAYRNPAQLPAGRVLVVGSGNSGAQIAEELARTHEVTVALGRRQPVLPQRVLGRDIFGVLGPLGFFDVAAGTRLGRWLQRRDPVIGTDLRHLARAGRLKLTARVVGAQAGTLLMEGGGGLEVEAVVWATGFRPEYSWLEVGVLDEHGRPVQRGGLTTVPGLFFLGLPWQRTRGSALLGGVGRDAEALVKPLACKAGPAGWDR